jgi:hypothetical protein
MDTNKPNEDLYLRYISVATQEYCRTYLERYVECNPKLYTLAFKRSCQIEFENHKNSIDPLIPEFWRTVQAYTILLLEKHNKGIKPTRSLQKIAKLGERATMASWMDNKHAREGFFNLIEKGMPEYTSEYLVIRFQNVPDQFGNKFTPEQIAMAKDRLEKAGVDIAKIELYKN